MSVLHTVQMSFSMQKGRLNLRLFSPCSLGGQQRCYASTLKHTQGRIVIIGSGWAGFKILSQIDQAKYEVVVVSPRNYFVFTPLLASTSVGTLEFRCITEPIRQHARDMIYYEGRVNSVDFKEKKVHCVLNHSESTLSFVAENRTVTKKPILQEISLDYDKLIIACGAVTQTFNIPGVLEHAFFLKDIGDARRIRFRVIRCFERADHPDTPLQLQRQLLHFAVVGGGPTGVEFSAELHDFITEDMARLYPELMDKVTMSLYDVAPKILTNFDGSLADYATNRFKRKGIQIRTGARVKELTEDSIVLQNQEEVVVEPVGLVVWATGLAPNPLIRNLSDSGQVASLDPGKRLYTDEYLRLITSKVDSSDSSGASSACTTVPDVFALGDCATIKGYNLPATAQVANQKAIYITKVLNAMANGKSLESQKSFKYAEMGSMAYIGGWKAIVNLKLPSTSNNQKNAASGGGNPNDLNQSGALAWLFWRSAYFTMSVSLKNKILIPMYWFLTWIFGRDTTKL